jgi:hypothetical protein
MAIQKAWRKFKATYELKLKIKYLNEYKIKYGIDCVLGNTVFSSRLFTADCHEFLTTDRCAKAPNPNPKPLVSVQARIASIEAHIVSIEPIASVM